jgi:hypothetical protein
MQKEITIDGVKLKHRVLPILFLVFIVSVFIYMGYTIGIGSYYIEERKGSYSPEYKYGSADIFIWHNGQIVYYDSYDWRPEVYEIDRANHLNMAHKFISEQK